MMYNDPTIKLAARTAVNGNSYAQPQRAFLPLLLSSSSSWNWSSGADSSRWRRPRVAGSRSSGRRGGFKSPHWRGAAHIITELHTGESLHPTITADLTEGETAKMATQPQQPPPLHLAELTAAQFIDIWKHFDSDGQCVNLYLLQF